MAGETVKAFTVTEADVERAIRVYDGLPKEHYLNPPATRRDCIRRVLEDFADTARARGASQVPTSAPREPRSHERRAPDGSIHWWACRIFCRPPVADASLACDCDSAKGPTSATTDALNDPTLLPLLLKLSDEAERARGFAPDDREAREHDILARLRIAGAAVRAARATSQGGAKDDGPCATARCETPALPGENYCEDHGFARSPQKLRNNSTEKV